jgi:transmembrane sensor
MESFFLSITGYTPTIMLDDRTWLLIARKMANEASAQEIAELESILRTSPELHFPLQTLSGLWQQVPTNNVEEAEQAYSNLIHAMRVKGIQTPGAEHDEETDAAAIALFRPRKPFYQRTGTVAAFVCAIAIALVWITNPFAPTPQVANHQDREPASEISTRYGSKTNIVLPDGSRVWLNAGSKITYDKDFGETSRNLQLTGEAYFDVVHNSSRPFVIHTKAMDIKVLGTEFNVKSYPDEKTTETSLIRGSIEVTLNERKADRIILKPNEKLVVSNEQVDDTVAVAKKAKAATQKPLISLSTLKYFSIDSTILETSWVQNRLVFEDESFEEIAIRMSRWYGVQFYFADEEIKSLRFTGNFKDETMEDALKAMQITADFVYRISDNIVTITKH